MTNGANKYIQNNQDDVILEKQKAADILSGIFFAAGKVVISFQINDEIMEYKPQFFLEA